MVSGHAGQRVPSTESSMGFYLQSKGLGPGHPRKTSAERVLTEKQWQAVLEACQAAKDENPKWWYRDYSALYLGYMFGCRVGEIVILERKHFSDLEKFDTARIPTLKQADRVQVICGGMHEGKPCARKSRIRGDRVGEDYTCPRCGSKTKVPPPKVALRTGAVDKELPLVEEQVIKFVLDYMREHMRPDQRWLFESRRHGGHISSSAMGRVFNTYLHRAGMSPKYSFHSLRHGRGVRLWSQFQDLVLVSQGLRHKDIKSAQIYAGLDPERREAYQKKLSKIAFDPLKQMRKVPNATGKA